jgi:hypothetical protein
MQNKTPNLFADILDVVREEDIHYVELRRAPEIEMDSIPAPAKPDCFEGDVQPLLERWSAGRTRLSSAARVAPVPVRGVEFVTWSALHDFSSCPLAFKYRHLLGVNAEITADSDGSSPPGIGAHGRSDALALGTLLHDYLCEYMASGQADDRRNVPPSG